MPRLSLRLRSVAWFVCAALLLGVRTAVPVRAAGTPADLPCYYITMDVAAGAVKYDDYLAVTCLQGLLNRESDKRFYLRPESLTQNWLPLLQQEGGWLADVTFERVTGLRGMMELGRDYVKTVVIWDEEVPATVNVATTAAGVENGIPLTETAYRRYKDCFNEDVKIIDLRGKFDGSVTGSAKNDAYRWAIEEYLKPGRCSRDLICSFYDSWAHRSTGGLAYVAQRDWATYNRAFVYDLSVWPDEAPFDDPDQPIGTDYATYVEILETMRDLTAGSAPYEVNGFFLFSKYCNNGQNTLSQKGDVQTEWEIVKLISPYHAYQNTVVEFTWNQSFHSQYPGAVQLRNNRTAPTAKLDPFGRYLCLFMGDYDSSYPLYTRLFDYWQDPRRGEVPLAWGIDPNLLDSYPDLIEYLYDNATPNDTFVSDASAAGYVNFNRVPEDQWPSVLQHHKQYFERADMTVAPMIMDRDRLSDRSLEMIRQFAPDGMATIIMSFGEGGSQPPQNYMTGDTPVARMFTNFDRGNQQKAAEALHNAINNSRNRTVTFAALAMMRCVWVSPTYVCEVLDLYRRTYPDEPFELVDIHTYFDLLRQDLAQGQLGDVDSNGSVNAADALLALQSSVKLTELDRLQSLTADVDGTGAVNAADALLILQCSVKLIDPLDFPAAW